ncbi:hypothetical protein GGX14DRAFT_580460 [Mycena pura]|uniref:Uncharacterized protein n=1 Tax=Mycena pura TaxID=153505 RepID=A0AAD6ULG5_9AGAR|nr:hypothetical protein GGX14DRAFT_580460 [Mycena pura]
MPLKLHATRSKSWWTSYADTVGVGLRSPLGKVNTWLEPDTMGKVLAFWWLVFLAMFGTTELTPEMAKARYDEVVMDMGS